MNELATPWVKTADFLKRSQIAVVPHSQGVVKFNTLNFVSSEDKIVLSREAKGDHSRTFFLEFEKQPEGGDTVVVVTLRLQTAGEEQLQNLRRIDGYSDYGPTGVKRIGRISQLKIIGANNLTIKPYGTPQAPADFKQAMLNFETGTLRLMKNVRLSDPARRNVNFKL